MIDEPQSGTLTSMSRLRCIEQDALDALGITVRKDPMAAIRCSIKSPQIHCRREDCRSETADKYQPAPAAHRADGLLIAVRRRLFASGTAH